MMVMFQWCKGLDARHIFGTVALGAAFFLGQSANADLLMLLEGDVESGGVALDSSGNQNHGIYLGSATGTPDGKSGGGINFNADASNMVTNRTAIGDSSISASPQGAADAFASINENQAFTIGFWYAGGDTNPRNSSVFWADGVTPDGGNRAIQSHATWSNSQVYLDIGGCCNGDTQRLNGPLEEDFFKASVGEEWTHLAFSAGVEDDIPFRRIYVDGEVFLEVEASSDNAELPIIDNFFIGSDNNGNNQWEGRMDDFFVADTMLSEDDVLSVYDNSARTFFGVEGAPEPVSASFLVFNENKGTHVLGGEVTNIVKGEPKQTQGLSQFWYDANLRAQPEAFLAAGDTGSDAAPLVAEPFATAETWWAGPQNTELITGKVLERYPASGLAGTRFGGSAGEDNYAVRLTGEIFIDEDGEYLLRDGIDDFTMIAIDQDGNGELDDLDSIIDGDVGTLFPGDPIGDVLVLDDDWANQNGASQEEAYHGIADVKNIAEGGEWRKIEIWMSEGGGGDAGIVYMGNLDDDDIFDETIGDALTQEEIDAFTIPGDKLRTVVSTVESADSAAALGSTEYVLQVAADGRHDAIVIDDGDGIFNTTLDVSGATIRIDAEEGIAEGTTYQILGADNFTGDLTLIADGFSFDQATGTLTFGAGGGGCDANTLGDLNGDGNVGFPDFLVLSANFGNDVGSHTDGDVNCDGNVGFADFLVLSANFGNNVGAQASVPEPSGLALLSLAGVALGFVRRRRS